MNILKKETNEILTKNGYTTPPIKNINILLSPCGSGKTQTLCELANNYRKNDLTVFYITGDVRTETITDRFYDIEFPSNTFIKRIFSKLKKLAHKYGFIKDGGVIHIAERQQVVTLDVLYYYITKFNPDVIMLDSIEVVCLDKQNKIGLMDFSKEFNNIIWTTEQRQREALRNNNSRAREDMLSKGRNTSVFVK